MKWVSVPGIERGPSVQQPTAVTNWPCQSLQSLKLKMKKLHDLYRPINALINEYCSVSGHCCFGEKDINLITER